MVDYNENEDDEDEDDEDDEDDDTSQVNEEIVVSSQPSVEPTRPVTPRASSRIREEYPKGQGFLVVACEIFW